MKNKSIILVLVIIGLITSCKIADVVNPNITDSSYLGTPQSSQAWVNGMNKQLALMLNQTVVDAEIVSDNYFNNSSLYNQVFDVPSLLPSDQDIDNMQRAIANLSQMAEYGLAKVAPADAKTTPQMKAQMYFIGGYAYLVGAELYEGLPITANGPVSLSADRLQKAIQYFNGALQLETDATKINVYTLALARSYYDLGDKTNAVLNARKIINASPLLLQTAAFDGVNGVSNIMQLYTFSNPTNVFAPLPRLDFLDPKFYNVGSATTDQKPIAILKGEEAYLIAAEAALGASDLAQAKTLLKNLITDVINKRPVTSVNSSLALRRGTRSDYPLTSTVKVKADSSSFAKSGLVLSRQAGNITVYTVSGTSVTTSDIDAATTVDSLLYLLCQMRQEIFMSEGRRMTDLGIRFPVSLVEKQNNPNVKPENTIATIPTYVPLNRKMDDFSYDRTAGVVTIKIDMNKVLVQHKNDTGILPMLK